MGIPQEAVTILLNEPHRASQFDEVYGEGASAPYLTSQKPGEQATMKDEEVSTLADIGRGVVHGAIEGVDSSIEFVQDIGQSAGEFLAQQYLEATDPETAEVALENEDEISDKIAETYNWDLPNIDAPTSTPGKVVKGISQFLTGFAAGGYILKPVQAVTKGGKVAKAYAQGGIGDLLSFDEHEDRLSNLLRDNLEVNNVVVDFLARDEDEAWLEGRLKNVLEGGIAGAAIDSTVRGLSHYVKAFKEARTLKVTGDTTAANRRIAQGTDEVQELFRSDTNAPATTEVLRNATGKAKAFGVDDVVHTRDGARGKVIGHNGNVVIVRGKDTEGVDQIFNMKPEDLELKHRKPRVTKGDVDSIVFEDPKIPAKDTITDEEVDELINNHWHGDPDDVLTDVPVNTAKWTDAEEALHFVGELTRIVRDRHSEAFTDVLSWKETKKRAAHYTRDPAKLLEKMRLQGMASDEIPAMMWATEQVIKKIGTQVAKLIDAYKGVPESMPPEVLEQIRGLTRVHEDILVDRGLISRASARTVGQGRAVKKEASKDYAVSSDQLTTLKSLESDPAAYEKFLKRVAQQAANPNKMLKMMREGAGGLVDKNNEFWMNAILSHPKTHVVNMASGAIETALKGVESTVALAIRGNLKGAKANVIGGYVGMRMGWKDSWEQAWDAFGRENNILDPFMRLYDFNDGLEDVQHAWKGNTGTAIRMPSRALQAEDEFMKQMNYRTKITMDTYVEGANKGWTKEEIADSLADRLRTGFDEDGGATNEAALQYAREATFTQDLKHGVGKWIQQGVSEMPFLRMVAPFVRAPTNLIRNAWQRTPLIGLLQKDMQRAMMSGNPKLRSEVISRQITGGLAALGFWYAVNEKEVTGGGPKDPMLRKSWMKTHQPYSIKEDGKWVQYGRMDPRFTLLGIMADYKEVMENAEDADTYGDLIYGMALATAKNVSNKTYTKGIYDVLDVLTSGEERVVKRFMHNRAASYVPNASKMLLTDEDEIKEIRSYMDAVMSRIPGLSESVEARRDVLGEKVLRGRTSSPVDPMLESKVNEDHLDHQLADLKHRWSVPVKTVAGTEIDLTEVKNEKTGQTVYDRMLELRGTIELGGNTLRERLSWLIEQPFYKQFPMLNGPNEKHLTSQRTTMIQKVISQYHKMSMHQAINEIAGLQDEVIRQKTENKLKIGTPTM